MGGESARRPRERGRRWCPPCGAGTARWPDGAPAAAGGTAAGPVGEGAASTLMATAAADPDCAGAGWGCKAPTMAAAIATMDGCRAAARDAAKSLLAAMTRGENVV